VNIKEDPHPDPEKGASGNDGEDYIEDGGYNIFGLLSHAKRQFVFWWFCGAVILAIFLALSATRFRTVHIHEVRLFGLFCWLAISWAGLLASYLFAWVLSYFWYIVCNLLFDVEENYNSVFADIRLFHDAAGLGIYMLVNSANFMPRRSPPLHHWLGPYLPESHARSISC
jgi:hypothetical protein